MPKRTDPRDRLRVSPRTTSPVAAWMERHAEARELVKAWVEMRRTGETAWGSRRLTEELRSEYGFPYSRDAVISYAKRIEEAAA